MLFLSAGTMIGGLIVGDIHAPLMFLIGLTGWLVAATGFLAGRSDITEVMLESARQRGFDQGYAAGRQVARPVVVPMSEVG